MEHITNPQALATRLAEVNHRVEQAARRSGRKRSDVTLVAVSKWHSATVVVSLAEGWSNKPAWGAPVFGESYVQESVAKMRETTILAPGLSLDWHFVGHLQSNKAKDVAGRFSLIHSVDSLKLAAALRRAWHSRAAEQPGGLNDPGPQPQAVLVQVNIGEEPQKSGVLPQGLEFLLRELASMPELSVKGLMCLPPDLEDVEEVRPYFARLRALRDGMQERLGLFLPHLSMGMSHDFAVAVEEGATLVRVGTDIFGPRE